MGFYHPATLVKDAQRRGVRFAPDRRAGVGLGLHGRRRRRDPPRPALRRRPARGRGAGDCAPQQGLRDQGPGTRGRPREDLGGARPSAARRPPPIRCPKCGCDDPSMIESVDGGSLASRVSPSRRRRMAADSVGQRHAPSPQPPSPQPPVSATSARTSGPRAPADRRFRSIDDLIRATGLRRDEVTVLAEIGALNSLGHDRRSALWQVERVVRPAGELFAAKNERRVVQGERGGDWGLGTGAGNGSGAGRWTVSAARDESKTLQQRDVDADPRPQPRTRAPPCEPAPRNERGRAPGGRLRRHRPHGGPASDGVPAARAVDARACCAPSTCRT